MFISDYKLDNLSSSLADNIVNSKKDPFKPNIVICQGKSMELYLNKTIADKKTIAANIQYRFPRNSINDILNLYDENSNVTRLDLNIMIWDIYFLLFELIDKADYKPLKDYINADDSSKELRQYQLSRQIASVFDFYIGYRGDWLESWQETKKITKKGTSTEKLVLGPHELWQADLWRKLTVEREDKIEFKRASLLLGECIEKISDKLPEKLSIFAISNMPQDYINFFKILNENEKPELNFYYITPCLEFWGDSTKKKAALEGEGNRLLASWGQLGRDFFNSLLDADFDLSGPDEESKPTEPETLLTALQYDILSNSSLDETKLKKFDAKDKSIVINSCYSRMREIEVLYDHILNELNEGKCEFSDIVVMAPNIEEYAPYIKAVFKQNAISNAEGSGKKSFIPFNISDCSTIFSSIEAETFIKILNLPKGKMTSEDIFDIISSEPVANKFNFSKEDRDKMYELISKSKIFWGKNNEHRNEILGMEYNDTGTWDFGFKRMLMGYAVDSEDVVDGNILPLNTFDNDGIVIGKLISVCKKIFDICDKMSESLSYDDWCDKIFYPIIKEFFELPNSKNEQIKPLLTAISSFKHTCSKSCLSDKEIPLDVAKAAIEFELNNESSNSAAFFRGSVTFCQLLPMRNIPFKNVCVLGMNDSEFPRINQECGFNLANKEYRTGDRNLRNEDRYIFLETLLATKEKFYISYIGQSNSTNEELPPSVLVDELLDYLESGTGKNKSEFVTKHPLHGFNEKYFVESEDDFYSYSKTYYNAAKSFENSKKISADELFCSEYLPLSDENLKNEFSFDEFVRFFLCPAKFFLKYRFNINLYDETLEPLDSSEPFELDNLEKYLLKDELLKHKIDEKEFDIENNLKASGILPPKVWGDSIFQDADGIAEEINEAVSDLGEKNYKTKEYKFDEKEFDIENFKFTITGTFDNIFKKDGQKVQVFFRPGEIKNKDKLKAWIWHQLAMQENLGIKKTILIGWDKKLVQEEICDCKYNLPKLVEIFVCGLKKPLPLFENSSPEFVKSYKKVIADDSLKVASKKWEKDEYSFYYDLNEYANFICFGESPPQLNDNLKDEFIELATEIFGNVDEAFKKEEEN